MHHKLDSLSTLKVKFGEHEWISLRNFRKKAQDLKVHVGKIVVDIRVHADHGNVVKNEMGDMIWTLPCNVLVITNACLRKEMNIHYLFEIVKIKVK